MAQNQIQDQAQFPQIHYPSLVFRVGYVVLTFLFESEQVEK